MQIFLLLKLLEVFSFQITLPDFLSLHTSRPYCELVWNITLCDPPGGVLITYPVNGPNLQTLLWSLRTSLSGWCVFMWEDNADISRVLFFTVSLSGPSSPHVSSKPLSPLVFSSFCQPLLGLIWLAAEVTDWPVNELFIGCKGNKLQSDVSPELSNESQDEVYRSLLLLSSQHGLIPKQG